MKLLKILRLVDDYSTIKSQIRQHSYTLPRRGYYTSRSKWKKALREWSEEHKKLKAKLKKLEDTEV